MLFSKQVFHRSTCGLYLLPREYNVMILQYVQYYLGELLFSDLGSEQLGVSD